MCLVTLSASYGAGGSRVGPDLARRLGVPFVDRVISSDVAARLDVPLDAALHHDSATPSHFLARFLKSLAPIGEAYGFGEVNAETTSERSIADAAERAVFERAASGRGVILGRAGAVVLRDDPRAVHVRLDGPREARLLQAMRLQGIDRETAERRMKETDPARYQYVRVLRRADARDPTLYHLLINSTVIELTACVEVIALATEKHLASALGASDSADVR
jgi:cytidylate kinase